MNFIDFNTRHLFDILSLKCPSVDEVFEIGEVLKRRNIRLHTNLSNSQKSVFDLAHRIAWQSDYEHFRHGAVLRRAGSIINTATNKKDFSAFGKRFRPVEKGVATRHAELGCVLGIDRSLTEDADVFVCRITKTGEMRLSKPCVMCQSAMNFVGIRRCFFSIGNGFFGEIRP